MDKKSRIKKMQVNNTKYTKKGTTERRGEEKQCEQEKRRAKKKNAKENLRATKEGKKRERERVTKRR